MRKVKCHDCGRSYDYDVDDFCPKCGAFTLPARASHIGSDGSVVWSDGINERGHRNSFVHSEYHAENQKRSRTWLEGRLPKMDLSGVGIPTRTAAAKRGKKGTASETGGMAIIAAVLLAYILIKVMF